MNAEIILTFQNLKGGEELEAALNGMETLSYERIDSKGFDGVALAMYVLSIGGGTVIAQLANVIVALFKKNEGMRVKIGDIEITGYSSDEVFKILDYVSKQSKN